MASSDQRILFLRVLLGLWLRGIFYPEAQFGVALIVDLLEAELSPIFTHDLWISDRETIRFLVTSLWKQSWEQNFSHLRMMEITSSRQPSEQQKCSCGLLQIWIHPLLAVEEVLQICWFGVYWYYLQPSCRNISHIIWRNWRFLNLLKFCFHILVLEDWWEKAQGCLTETHHQLSPAKL